MEQRHSSLQGDLRCGACAEDFGQPTRIEWQAIYHTTSTALGTLIGAILAMGGAGALPYRRVKFSTLHLLCPKCRRSVTFRQIGGVLLDKLCFIALLLSSIGLVMGFVFGTAVVVFATGTPFSEIGIALALIVASGSVFALGVYGAHRSKLLPTPKPLRTIGKPPFTILKVHPLTEVPSPK